MNLRLTVSVDDINPKKGYRVIGEPVEKWFKQLNQEFGVKFTCFIPSCYHGEYPISQHKGWIQELNSIEWLELAAHGHYHMTNDPQRFGECEFMEIQDDIVAKSRIVRCLDEWRECDVNPLLDIGWRSPGWLCSELSKKIIEQNFQYVAIHYEHNQGMEWKCKTFFGHDNIQNEHIGIHNGDMIMFQSHIAGNHNLNVWNESNYEQLRYSLEHLVKNNNIEFKTLKECL